MPYPLVWPVTAHVFAMFPDLLFTAGIAHYWWMDLFLGHISTHFVPGRNLTWYLIFLTALGLYLTVLYLVTRPASPVSRAGCSAGRRSRGPRHRVGGARREDPRSPMATLDDLRRPPGCAVQGRRQMRGRAHNLGTGETLGATAAPGLHGRSVAAADRYRYGTWERLRSGQPGGDSGAALRSASMAIIVSVSAVCASSIRAARLRTCGFSARAAASRSIAAPPW